MRILGRGVGAFRQSLLILRFALFWTSVLLVWFSPIAGYVVGWSLLSNAAPSTWATIGVGVISAGCAWRFGLWLWLRLPADRNRTAAMAADTFLRRD